MNNNSLSCVAPPAVPSMDRAGVVAPSAEKYREEAYGILNAKVQKLLANYKDNKVDIVEFAHKVHKLGILFRATIGLICTHDRESALVESVTKLRLEPQVKLEDFFDAEVRRIEKLAQEAFNAGRFAECYALEKPLATALIREKGSIRHFSLQSWVLASACNLEYVDEVVQLVTSLEVDVPDAHRNWFMTTREKVVTHIQAQFAANEVELRKILEEAVRISEKFDLVLNEAIDLDGQSADVQAVLKEFTACGARLDAALVNHDKIHGWLESLRSSHRSVRDEVCHAFTLGNERCGLIHNLTATLAQKNILVDQIDYLQNWLHTILESNRGEEFRSVETYALILLLQKCFTDGASDALLLKLLDTHGNKLARHFENVGGYIVRQRTAIEDKLTAMNVRLEAVHGFMRDLFTKTHNGAQNVLEDLVAIDQGIQEVDAVFQPCKQHHVKVLEVTKRSGFETQSLFDQVSNRLDHCIVLAKETRALAVDLSEELDVDSRHETYRTWIETHKGQFIENRGTLLSSWVVKMFLESYFSGELSENVKQATEKFLQEQSEWIIPCIQAHQTYLDEEWKKNEDALTAVFAGVGEAVSAVGKHLEAGQLHAMPNFEAQLQAVVSQELGNKDVLDACVLLNGKLRFLHDLADIKMPSGCQDVSQLFERNTLLQARAKKLHDALVGVDTVDAKIEAVRTWMGEDMGEYEQESLSYIHKAALAILDAYYFSPKL
ncbi:MAG: hypothetical protein LLF94_04605, partial [Chlamydiales bacterium]|nr:hypothetical protein [Chlamydiales bacterium]